MTNSAPEPPTGVRRVLVLSHTGRSAARDVTTSFCKALTEHDIVVRLLADEAADLGIEPAAFEPTIELVTGDTDLAADCELAVVVGGDGSILRAAEVTWGSGTPVLGVNLGHIGFLAEAEVDDVEDVIEAIVERRWLPEDRMALDVRAFRDGELVTHTFALNEASVEKAARERMIEVVVEIDSRPLSRWGCDGVVLATPTGSTAYNFSAGGPIVWPTVEALLVVPLSAHALFARDGKAVSVIRDS
ncbi:MAG TPA: NAD(+)/NADH kinase, partial [Nocardioides sp.]|nr:NAD(+)/NADH kinase [Nocardioides sp.]